MNMGSMSTITTKKMKEIDLFRVQFFNNQFDEFISRIDVPNLSSVFIAECVLSSLQWSKLLLVLTQCPRLRYLTLFRSEHAAEIVNVLLACPIKFLILCPEENDKNKVTKGIQLILQCLPKTEVYSLNIYYCNLGLEAFEALKLFPSPIIKRLYIKEVNDTICFQTLCEAITFMQIDELSFGSIDLDLERLQYFEMAINAIESINFGVSSFDYEVFNVLCLIIRDSMLIGLDLRGLSLDVISTYQLVNILSNTKLHLLRLGHMEFTPDSLQVFTNVLRNYPAFRLHTLQLTDCIFPDDHDYFFQAILSQMMMVNFFFMSSTLPRSSVSQLYYISKNHPSLEDFGVLLSNMEDPEEIQNKIDMHTSFQVKIIVLMCLKHSLPLDLIKVLSKCYKTL